MLEFSTTSFHLSIKSVSIELKNMLKENVSAIQIACSRQKKVFVRRILSKMFKML